jgi:hypothetical protein
MERRTLLASDNSAFSLVGVCIVHRKFDSATIACFNGTMTNCWHRSWHKLKLEAKKVFSSASIIDCDGEENSEGFNARFMTCIANKFLAQCLCRVATNNRFSSCVLWVRESPKKTSARWSRLLFLPLHHHFFALKTFLDATFPFHREGQSPHESCSRLMSHDCHDSVWFSLLINTSMRFFCCVLTLKVSATFFCLRYSVSSRRNWYDRS